MEAVNRTIVLANFYGDGKHLYEDELGWWPSVKEEAHSQISRDIFEYEIVPIEFKILPMDKSQKNTCWQCEFDTHDDGEVLFSFVSLQDYRTLYQLASLSVIHLRKSGYLF